ncbi:MAG TPA: flagellar biosynthetic protein FliO, partial [Desulfuromonadales bacterium]|nr:flagellar biosynthetic protein FliO [Desulfuromonadales bacterium]
LLLLPSIALAASTGSGEYSFMASFVQMIAALAMVVGLILVTWYFSGKLMRGLPTGNPLSGKHIRLIESRYLGPKKSLVLIEVGGEYLLLSSSDNQLRLIKQIDMLEEIEVVDENQQQGSFATLLNRLRRTS